MSDLSVLKNLYKACAAENGLLAIINLDNITSFYEAYGEELADRLHLEFTRIIDDVMREDDIKASLGNDEIIIFAKNMNEKSELEEVYSYVSAEIDEYIAEELSEERLSDLIEEDSPISMEISVGAVMVPQQGTDYTTLFTKADRALYIAKNSGRKHEIVYYSDELDASDVSEDMAEESAGTEKQMSDKPARGAVWTDKSEYKMIYNYLTRYISTYNNSACEMVITIKPAAESLGYDEYEKLIKDSGNVIAGLFRHSDIIMRERESFRVLLAEMETKNIIIIVDRIKKGLQNAGLYMQEKIILDSRIIAADGEHDAWIKVAV
ncbi:MAG: diguanylate cyclase [Eubacterium sp.]|nr:diguanylate cyclase [Eubacterium sp.]